MHSEIVLPGGQMKDQPKTVQISCNICAFIKHMQCITHNAYFVTYVFFMLSLSYRYRANVDCVIFYLVILLKITDKVTTLKYIFTCI